jgi:hypothetical protein
MLTNGPVRRPQQLRSPAALDASLTQSEIEALFGDLKKWADEYLATESMILERAAKSQRFSDYLLKKASERRTAAETNSGRAN